MRKNSGGAAEEAAVLFLEGKGIRILERNFRSYHGEIDIIALEQEMILVVEVKMRSYGDCGTAAEAVDFLIENSGTMFSPELVQIFIQQIQVKLYIKTI